MCQFNISFSSTPEGLVNRAQRQIEKAGGNFTGDSSQGNFGIKTPIGSIAGGYQINGQVIAITITDKPFLLSCSRIESELKGILQ